MATAPGDRPASRPDRDATQLVVFTSGTTGRQKGVQFTAGALWKLAQVIFCTVSVSKDQVVANLALLSSVHQVDSQMAMLQAMLSTGLVCESDVWAHCSPMFHVADLMMLFTVTIAGGTHAMLPRC